MKVFATVARMGAVVMVLLSLTVASAKYCYKNYPKVEIRVKHDPSQTYTLHISQIGSPGFPFGSVTAELVVKNRNGGTLDKCRFEINNDGCAVLGGNLKDIRWQTDTVEVDIQGADDASPTTYVLRLKNGSS